MLSFNSKMISYFKFWNNLKINNKILIRTSILCTITTILSALQIPLPILPGLTINISSVMIIISAYLVGPWFTLIIVIFAPLLGGLLWLFNPWILLGSPILICVNLFFLSFFLLFNFIFFQNNNFNKHGAWFWKFSISLIFSAILTSILISFLNQFLFLPLYGIYPFSQVLSEEAFTFLTTLLIFNTIQFSIITIFLIALSIPILKFYQKTYLEFEFLVRSNIYKEKHLEI